MMFVSAARLPRLPRGFLETAVEHVVIRREPPTVDHRHKPDSVKSLSESAREFTSNVKRNFADQLRGDPHALKRELVHLLKINLPPGPGRPCDEAVTNAVQLKAQGKSWREIYPLCIPDYPHLSGDMRQQAQSKLRDAVRSRRNTRRRRSNPHQ